MTEKWCRGGSGTYKGFHCNHWAYTADQCCYCETIMDNEDDRCPGQSS